MKILLVGAGSIGLRHLCNLLALYPDAEIVVCDPLEKRAKMALAECKNAKSRTYKTFEDALEHALDADYAIIASPDKEHIHQAASLFTHDIAFYLEKPACDLSAESIALLHNISVSANIFLVLDSSSAAGGHCTMGYQYRFHPVIIENYARWQACGYLRFYARDDLKSRYGANCLAVMAAHPIDTALYVLGPVDRVEMQTNGLSVTGRIWHTGGGLSEFDIAMQPGPRVSQITAGDGGGWSKTYDLDRDDGMYLSALKAWLDWFQGGERDKRTATLAEGWASMEVMKKIKQV